jgi:aspartyl-tRNA(Asn)/glutamyl-tRNA(Gln) amidotransferase subunit A
MAKVSRREFSRICGGVALSATLMKAWPALAQPMAAADADKLTSLSLTEVSAMIRDRRVTSTELVKALLVRIDIYNPKVDAYVTVMADDALQQAAVLDAEQKAGKLRGPLHGIPIALKDNIDTAGTRTTAASPMFKDRVPAEDAAIVTKLKAAGAVILGKTNLHEFALGCTGDVSYFGPARNPWELDRVTGGSSSGSASALAAQLCYGALGTDTGGSIRVPSAWCGTVGLKPTTGLVSIRGIIPCTASLDHCGPMARSVEDVALMLNFMAGYDNLDIFSVHSEPQDYMKLMKEPISSLRLGMPASFYDHVEDDVSKPVADAIQLLSKMTAGVTSHAPLLEASSLGQKLGDSDYYHGDLIRQYGLNYMPPTRARFEKMMNPPPGMHETTAAESAEAHQKLALIRRTIDAAFTNFDVVVIPTVRSLPPTIEASLAFELAGPNNNKKVYDWFQGSSACSNTSPFDLYGIPAITVPCGFSTSGMPIGLMIAGPHFTEGRILALAYAYQQATQWHTKRPPLTPDTPVPPIVEKPPAYKKAAS